MRRARGVANRLPGGGGFSLMEIMIVVAIMAILVAIAAPAWVRARSQSRMKSCQENLTKIDGAKEQYALENSKKAGDPVTVANIVNPNPTSGYLNEMPPEPSGYSYVIDVIGSSPSCTSAIGGHTISEIGLTITAIE